MINRYRTGELRQNQGIFKDTKLWSAVKLIKLRNGVKMFEMCQKLQLEKSYFDSKHFSSTSQEASWGLSYKNH